MVRGGSDVRVLRTTPYGLCVPVHTTLPRDGNPMTGRRPLPASCPGACNTTARWGRRPSTVQRGGVALPYRLRHPTMTAACPAWHARHAPVSCWSGGRVR